MKITKKVIDRVIISFTESEKKKADKYLKDNGYELFAISHESDKSKTMLYIGEKEKK